MAIVSAKQTDVSSFMTVSFAIVKHKHEVRGVNCEH